MKVYLVGAGPGDPDLITVKARRLLENARSILYDNLANHSLLDLAPADAEKLYVGKKKSDHTFSQQEICDLLIDRARRGIPVIRLKGGDPFIFGRGGEEAEALYDASIPFEIVPGVTSPLGIAAYAGIPLTHRSHTSVVTFVTGHDPDAIDWTKIGSAETLVILMGLTTFADIAARIIAQGRSPDTPAAAVRWGTRPDQETLAGTLATLPGLIHERNLKPPTTIIVGEVVNLRGKLNWYERLPLFGKTVIVTRAREQAPALSSRLHALGANVIEIPTIEIVPPGDPGPLDRAIARLQEYDWIVFTSVNGVRFFLDRLDASRSDLRAVRAKLCAIGPATRAALESLHLKVDLMGEEYVAESLLAAFESFDVANQRILLPRAAIARDLIPAALTARGAHVEVVEAYRTIAPPLPSVPLHADWITFTSSSTIRNLAPLHDLSNIRIASIGPITSATIRSLGLEVAAEASPYTIDGLVDAIIGQ